MQGKDLVTLTNHRKQHDQWTFMEVDMTYWEDPYLASRELVVASNSPVSQTWSLWPGLCVIFNKKGFEHLGLWLKFHEKGVILLVLQLENHYLLKNSSSLPSSKQGFAPLRLLLSLSTIGFYFSRASLLSIIPGFLVFSVFLWRLFGTICLWGMGLLL